MGDSDDEYDRRRARDKFRRERSDYQERREDRSRREDFPERDSWSSRDRSGRREYRDYDPRGRRERYSPPRHDLSPPIKRMRRDWDDRGGYGGNYGGGYDMGYPPSGGGGPMMPPGHWGGGGMGQDMAMMHGGHNEPEAGLTQPLMKTFKAFLGMQDDTIDDQEAVKKYNEYKQDFKKNQISEFFINHKEEEWFKSKYHPEEYGKRYAEQMAALKKRLDTFMELLDANWVDQVSIDVEKSDQIVRLLDAVVIKLEGGTDNDLRALDEPIEEEKPKDQPPAPRMTSPNSNPSKPALLANSTMEYGENKVQEEKVENDSKPKDSGKTQVSSSKKRSSDSENEDSSDSSGSSSGEDSEDDDDDDEDDDEEEEEEEEEDRKKKKNKKKKIKIFKEEPEVKKEESKENLKVDIGCKEEKIELKAESKSPSVDTKPVKVEGEIGNSEAKDVKTEITEGDEVPEEGALPAETDAEAPEIVKVEEDLGPPRPRPLHRTCSIFLRNLAPTITKQEVESICKRYNGFLRVAIADPQPERRFFRRGWVTFERTENIKDTCWNLNNIRLRDCELGAIVNRDLSRRIRSVNGITSHKQVVRSDIKLAARIIQNLDGQKLLWISREQKDIDIAVFGLGSKNPLLKNITDYLIEEASAEEEELLGVSASEDPAKEGEDSTSTTNTLEKDETLIKVLDRILLYLRIVHSVDYYNHSEYPNEDEMPNRCGIMHARGSNPTSKVTQPEILEYNRHFEQKVGTFLQPQSKLSEEEADKLGRKDPEAEVEKFVQANSQELAKDKWLCPLSGKKFKGPEFIRKHIFNKHGEKVDEVKKEVEYFNNYLQDPKRPQLPEHPANRQQQGGGPGGPRGEIMMPYPGGPAGAFPPGAPPFPGGFRGPPPAFGPGGFGGRNNFQDMYGRGFNKRNNYGRGGRTDPRAIIDYHDLDYPQDID